MNLPEGWPTEEMVAAGFEVVRQAAPNERAFRIALFRAMLAAAPTPPAQEGPDFPDGCDSEGFPGGCERFGHTPQTCPNAQENEPVGYLDDRGNFWSLARYEIEVENHRYHEFRALYTRPTDDKLRKAAEEAYVLLTDITQQLHLNAACEGVIENLRAALEDK